MGVPSFVKWLLKKSHNIILNNISHPCTYLYIDCNALIHQISNSIISEFHSVPLSELYILICNKLISVINDLYIYSKSQFLYISIDGSVPMSKVIHQRLRRYKNVHENSIRQYLKKKHNILVNTAWNSLVITPGTDFMDLLDSFLLSYCSDKSYITYSSYHHVGEGEHKIIHHIKQFNTNNIIIYSPDADLIFLALSLNKEHVYILRNDTEIENKLIYFSIDIIKQCLLKELPPTININDFIFVCFLIGNDFIPHLPSIHIYTSGIEKLINCMLSFPNPNNESLISDNNININFLIHIFKIISISELSYITNTKSKLKHTCPSNNIYDIELFKFENLHFITKPIIISSKSEYYLYYFGIFNPSFVDNLCLSYITGLYWLCYYYFDSCIDFKWFYPYAFAPLANDLYMYLMNNKINITFTTNPPISILTQLLLVIPPQHSDLLPLEIQPLYTHQKLNFMFPTQISFDFKNNFLWQCKPILPLIDLNIIEEYINKIKLNENSILKNKIYN